MSRFFIQLFCFIIPFNIFAQGERPSFDQIKLFKETTTLVVLNGQDVAFEAMLNESVRKFWTITPFEIISAERYEKMKGNSAFSFLVLTQVVFDKDKNNHKYSFLNLLLSHPSGDINQMPVIAYIPFSGDSTTFADHIYKTGILVKAIQYQINQIIQEPKLIKKSFSKYNRNIPKLKEKTLLITANDVTTDLADLSALKRLYKNNIEIIGSEEIEKRVIKGSENIATIHKVVPNNKTNTGNCYKMLIDTNDGTIYYYKTDRISPNHPGKISKKDFRKIRRYSIQ